MMRAACTPRRLQVAVWRAATLLVLWLGGTAGAQPGAEVAAADFEELTVRRAPGSRQMLISDFGGSSMHYVVGQASLKDLIGLAGYANVPSSQLVGGPDWLDRYGFDVTMVVRPGGPDRQSALRYVLEQRFKLEVHVQTDPVFVLETLPRGLMLAESGRESLAAPSSQELPGWLSFKAGSSSNLAAALSRDLGRPVLDHTRLTARYDFDLSWSVVGPLEPGDTLDGRAAKEAYAQVLDAALREQLGLRLRSFPLQTLVVDRAELPVDD
jgi:uncharacterized protein (TIGR03435 family)